MSGRDEHDLRAGGYSRRQIVRGLAAGAASGPLAAFLAACGGGKTTGGGATTAAGTPAGTGGSGVRMLTLAVPATPPGWDQDTDSGPVINDMISALNARLFDYNLKSYQGGLLVDLGGPDKLVPSLATGYEAHGKSVIVHLRKGVMSHAGNEMTAKDVVWTFGDRAFGLKAVGAFLNSVSGIASPSSIKAVDDYTVQFKLEQPNDIFLLGLGIAFRSVYDSTEFKAHATKSDPFATKWAHTGDGGFGPFKLATVEPGNQIVLERFEKFFNKINDTGGSAAHVDKLIVKEVPSPADRTALVSKGSVDLAVELTARQLQTLQSQDSAHVWNFPSTNIAIYQIDPKIPPLDNKLVRQALAYAAPYDALVNNVLLKTGKRAGGPLPSLFPGYANHFQQYTTDLDKAKALLKQAGHAGGFKTKIAYLATNPVQEQMSILLQSNLSEIGIKADLVSLTDANYVASQHSTKTSDKYPIVSYIDGPLVPEPYYGLFLNFQSKSPLNWSQVDVPGIDALLAKMKDVTDFEERKALADQAQKIIADEVPWIFVAEPGIQVASSKAVSSVGCSVGYLAWEDFAS
jgi:peptide/nickel transport system substrate-binding protein